MNVGAVELGRRVREAREAANIEQTELARRVGVTQPNISQIENGARTPIAATIAALERELGMYAGELTDSIEMQAIRRRVYERFMTSVEAKALRLTDVEKRRLRTVRLPDDLVAKLDANEIPIAAFVDLVRFIRWDSASTENVPGQPDSDPSPGGSIG